MGIALFSNIGRWCSYLTGNILMDLHALSQGEERERDKWVVVRNTTMGGGGARRWDSFKNGVFWVVTPCGSCGSYKSHTA
jgi:hypothetical protein